MHEATTLRRSFFYVKSSFPTTCSRLLIVLLNAIYVLLHIRCNGCEYASCVREYAIDNRLSYWTNRNRLVCHKWPITSFLVHSGMIRTPFQMNETVFRRCCRTLQPYRHHDMEHDVVYPWACNEVLQWHWSISYWKEVAKISERYCIMGKSMGSCIIIVIAW